MYQILQQITDYRPCSEQEAADRERILQFLRTGETPFSRENPYAHMTASAWVVNPAGTKVLMVYHNIYRSWSWMGGHADGETDLLAVALREAREESGIRHVRPVSEEIFSLEVLTVDGHEKKGCYVSSHLHMNVTYLLMADESESLSVKPDENSGVRWIDVNDLPAKVSEPWMMERIYRKLAEKPIPAPPGSSPSHMPRSSPRRDASPFSG